MYSRSGARRFPGGSRPQGPRCGPVCSTINIIGQAMDISLYDGPMDISVYGTPVCACLVPLSDYGPGPWAHRKARGPAMENKIGGKVREGQNIIATRFGIFQKMGIGSTGTNFLIYCESSQNSIPQTARAAPSAVSSTQKYAAGRTASRAAPNLTRTSNTPVRRPANVYMHRPRIDRNRSA